MLFSSKNLFRSDTRHSKGQDDEDPMQHIRDRWFVGGAVEFFERKLKVSLLGSAFIIIFYSEEAVETDSLESAVNGEKCSRC